MSKETKSTVAARVPEATFVPVPIDADRVCGAISQIGYRPASALMDIIDNSVAAGARDLAITLELDPSKSIGNKNNVLSYTILDDGSGMTDDEVLNAVALGSNALYSPNSLSKYGLGLKSAGLSMGERISIVSQKDGTLGKHHVVDRSLIRTQGTYGVAVETAPPALVSDLRAFLGDKRSGTMVRVSACTNTHQESAQSTFEVLRDRLGVVYYEFLRRTPDPLAITVRVTGKPDFRIEPFDILFSEIALPHFDADAYDGKLPCLAFRGPVPVTEGESEPAILEVVLFPPAKMNTNPAFNRDERALIGRFAVARKNKGFFIYRNGRLIKWGDDLDGIVGKDDLGFRARLIINTTHDDALQVDVSKQRLDIPEDIRKKIELCVRTPKRALDDLWTKCKEILDLHGPSEGQSFSERNTLLADEDLDAPTEPPAKEVAKRRRATIRQETERKQEDEPLPPVASTQDDQTPVFQKVRYSDRVTADALWEAAEDPIDGAFVRVNRNHPFYQTILGPLGATSGVRQAFEALLWAAAAAENKTRQHLPDIQDEDITTVLKRFKKVLASNLGTWSAANQDILDND
jgi:hypothetical protein